MKKLSLLLFLVILLTACGGEIASPDQLTQKVQSINAANATPTPTAKPTNTPKPEPTPKPSATSAPTDTPKPTVNASATQTAATQVAEIRQTATAIAIVNATSPAPIPTIKTVITTVVAKGTGLSRGEIKVLFEKQYKFKFQESSQVNNQPRTMGKSPNGLALLELIGPLTNLTSVNLSITAVSDNQAANTQSVQYFISLLQNVLPSWTESSTWLSTGINSLLKDGQEVTTTMGNLKFSLSNVKELGLVSLIITAA